MSPALLLTIIQAAITETPALISTLEKLFATGNVTVEGIEALKASIAAESFATLAPNSEAQIESAASSPAAP